MAKTSGTIWHMNGTEGTGRYVVLASTARGRVGIRVLNGEVNKITHISAARIRVEPEPNAVEEMAGVLLAKSWKQPGQEGQQRFSKVVETTNKNSAVVKRSLTRGLKALGIAEGLVTEVNPEAPVWAKSLIGRLQQST